MQSLNKKEITSSKAAARNLLRSALFIEVYVLFFVDFKELKIRFGWRPDRFTTASVAAGIVPTSEFLRDDLQTFLYYVLTRLSYPQYPTL